jgi:hypothetical protein
MPSLIPDFATLERRLAGLPVVKHRAQEVVLTAGSKTGSLLFLRSGTVEVIKDGMQIAPSNPQPNWRAAAHHLIRLHYLRVVTSGTNEPQFPVVLAGNVKRDLARLENRGDRGSFREGAGLKTVYGSSLPIAVCFRSRVYRSFIS